MAEQTMYGHDLLLRAAADAAYPATPPLRSTVEAHVATRGVSPTSPSPARRAFAPLAALGVAAGVILAVFVVPTSRSAVADFFGIEGSRIDILPTATAPTPFPTPQDIDANAVPSTIEQAAVLAGFSPALLEGTSPSRVYTVSYGAEHGVILRYPEFDLWQVGEGSFEGYFDKGVPSDVVVTDLIVAGVPGTWITGGPHFVLYHNGTDDGQGEPRTVERNTLIWRTDAALYRIETLLPIEEALAIADTLP